VLNEKIPAQSVDYVLTDPPFGTKIEFLPLSTFWGGWLGFHFDYDRELVVANRRGKTQTDYHHRLQSILNEVGKATKRGKYVHFFCDDIKGPYLHVLLKSLRQAGIMPERVLDQPPPGSFGARARAQKGHFGSYLVRGKALNGTIADQEAISEAYLRGKVARAALTALRIRRGTTPIMTVLHSVYQKLSRDEIVAFAEHPAEQFLRELIREFAKIDGDDVRLSDYKADKDERDIANEIRSSILDAISMFAGESDIKNQVYQRVLRRFESDGITIDDIRAVEEYITESDKIQYRTKRTIELIQIFGQALGFQTQAVDYKKGKIIWQRGKEATCLFQLPSKYILVGATQSTLKEEKISNWGWTTYRQLEEAIGRWCELNPDQSASLKGLLNAVGKGHQNTTSQEQRKISPQRLRLKVLKNKMICPKHYRIDLQIPRGIYIDPLPGQFFHIICDPLGEKTLRDNQERGYPLTLRRPFSVHGINYTNFDRRFLAKASSLPKEIREILIRDPVQIDFLYKVVGEGTEDLSSVKRGTLLDVIGPIGNGFNIGQEDAGIIVAGGIGVAPLVALAERLRYLDKKVYIYLGALRAELLQPALARGDSVVERSYANGTEAFVSHIENEFKQIGAGDVKICTDDGSVGQKGRVADILEKDLKNGRLPQKNIRMYACGPSKMLQSVSDIASRYSIKCEVLLEERMACGIGACFSCTCDVLSATGKEEKRRVCIDGPVFNAAEVKWK
jgi:dihydroorotate dehydrogenase electron transfer subunit